jgi:osmotically-inducible protein OsmY
VSPTLAEDLTTDTAIRRRVEERLGEEDLTGITVTVHGAVVTLRGTVATLAIKLSAIAHARDASDGSPVVSELSIPRVANDERLTEAIARRVEQYVFFTIFDEVAVEVDEGLVRLSGRVTMPFKADAFAAVTARVAGVQAIDNTIRVLPASQRDDQLRYTIATWLYGDPLFRHYALQVNPPVHIIVEHGDVTLTGFVYSEVERRTAEVIARSTVALSVTNLIRVQSED